MKKNYITYCLLSSMMFVAGCGSTSTTTTTVGDFTLAIPTEFTSIAPATLDATQIAHTIIAGWKGNKASIVLSESSLPSSISLKEFTQETQKRLSQDMVGYNKGKLATTSFVCNNDTINGYTHTFVQTDIQDTSKIQKWYNQLYFARNGSVYILSLAQEEEKSIFSDIVSSLGCTSTK